MLAIMSAVLVSCTKSEINEDNGNSSNEEENPSEEIYLNVYYDDIVFPSKGGEDYFDIESNTDWTISNTSDWLTIEPAEGNGNASVTLTASASDVYDDRNTVITVKAGDKTETFTVTQKYAEALLVTKNKFDVPQEGGDFTIEIQSNISYEIQIDSDSQSWISEAPQSKALTTYSHTFLVKSNPNTTKRDGSIEIIGSNGKTETVNIYQAQRDELVLSESEETVPAKGGEVRVQLRSNVDYEVIMPENTDWVEQIQSDKADELVFNVKPNDRTEDREAVITVKDKNSDLSQTFTIKQIVGSIILEDSYFEVDAKGGSIEVNLSTDIDFEVIIPENIDWVTRIETKSLEKRTFNLNVLPNSQTEEREAEITIKDINSDVAQTLTIKQKVGQIIVEQNEFEVPFKGGTVSIPYSSDIECKVIIPESAQSWISVVETKSMESHEIQLSIALNEEKNKRTETITIQDINSPLSQNITITQLEHGYYKGNIKATSEAGLKRIYDAGYTIIDGDVYLNVKTLSQLGNLIEEIRGNLELGEDVVSLDGLYGLTSIGGDLVYSLEYSVTTPLQTFEGLNNLKTIGGNFEFRGAGYSESSPSLSLRSLKNLETIEGNVSISFVNMFDGLDNLKNIGGDLRISELNSCTGLSGITSLNNFNANLVHFDSFENFCTNLTTISGNLYFGRCDIKSFKGLDNLNSIGGDFHFAGGCDNLTSFDGLSNLQTIGGDFIIDEYEDWSSSYFSSLESFKGLENLKAINGNFYMHASFSSCMNKLKTFEGLTNLSKIGGDFEIEASWSLNSLQSLHGLDNLSEIGGNFIITNGAGYGDNKKSLSLLTFSDGPRNLSIINGNFIIMAQGVLDNSYPSISSMTGFAGLERINGNLEIDNISSFIGLGNLKYIEGDFILGCGDTQGLSKLTTIGGNLIANWDIYSDETVVPEINGLVCLKTINGSLSISGTSMATINGITQLQKVGGDITISNNNKLEDISGLSGLTNCANVSITSSPNLYNFQPLETAAKNMTGTWYVYGCGYNPTKYQMLNGESKPQE